MGGELGVKELTYLLRERLENKQPPFQIHFIWKAGKGIIWHIQRFPQVDQEIIFDKLNGRSCGEIAQKQNTTIEKIKAYLHGIERWIEEYADFKWYESHPIRWVDGCAGSGKRQR